MIYFICRFIIGTFFRALYAFKIEGSQNLPAKGPFIIASNHASFYDPPVIIASVPLKIHWVITKRLYNLPLLNKILKFSGHVSANGASGKVMEILKDGKVVGIFPEGTRTHDGNLLKAKTGVALLAMKAKVPVIPCGITGTFEAYPRNVNFPRPGKIKIAFGKPILFDGYFEEPIADDILEAKTDIIMNSIRMLLSK